MSLPSGFELDSIGRLGSAPPATDAQIQAIESAFGVKLPADYIALLKLQNGGYPKKNIFRFPGQAEEEYCRLSHFYQLVDDREDSEGVWSATHVWRQARNGRFICIGDDGCGDQLLLWYDDDVASVQLLLHDRPGFPTVPVSGSFATFLDSLASESQPD